MPRDYKVYLEDIREASRKIRDFTKGFSLQDFTTDERTFDAVVRNLEIIGEAVKQIPEDVRSQQPDVEWKRIARLRDILAHRYFGIDVQIVWDIVQNKITPLEKAINALLA